MIIPNNWRLPYDSRMTVGLLLGGLPVEEYLDAGHLIDLPVAPFAHAAEVGVPLQVDGKVDGDVAEQAVVEFQLEVEVGLKGALGQPVLALQVGPFFAIGEGVVLGGGGFGAFDIAIDGRRRGCNSWWGWIRSLLYSCRWQPSSCFWVSCSRRRARRGRRGRGWAARPFSGTGL